MDVADLLTRIEAAEDDDRDLAYDLTEFHCEFLLRDGYVRRADGRGWGVETPPSHGVTHVAAPESLGSVDDAWHELARAVPGMSRILTSFSEGVTEVTVRGPDGLILQGRSRAEGPAGFALALRAVTLRAVMKGRG